MGDRLIFKRPKADYADMEELLRPLADEEREERECDWFEEAVRRAKRIHQRAAESGDADPSLSGPPAPKGCG